MRACKRCGDEFRPLANQHYCGKPCLSPSAWNLRKKFRACATCGENTGHLGHRYCGDECRRAKVIEDRECAECHRAFTPAAPAQRYCQNPCVSPSLAQQSRTPTPCRVCGGDTGHAIRLYCGPGCEPKRETPAPRERQSRTCIDCGKDWFPANPHVRAQNCFDCRQADLAQHTYSTKKAWRSAVRRRANSLCEECGATELETGVYHHAHHVLPQSEGGQHTLDNARFLCVNCHDEIHGGRALGGLKLSQGTDADLVEQIAERVVELLYDRLPHL